MVGKERMGPALSAGSSRPIPAARKRVLDLLERRGSEGLSIAEGAEILGGHPNAARSHLEGLADEGLASRNSEPATGRGRPAFRYRITASGRSALVAGAGDDDQGLARAFVEYSSLHRDPAAVRAVGQLWAKSAGESVSPDSDLSLRLTRLMATAGFNPVAEAGSQSVELHSCPFIDQARKNRVGICGVHQDLIDGALQAWEPGSKARLQPFSRPGACTIAIR